MRLLPWVVLLLAGAGLGAADEFTAGMEAYQRGDYATAFAQWRPLAESGSLEAQFNLGLMYQKGQGTDADPQRAVEWYAKAADQGFVRAQYNLAQVYEAGDGIATDPFLAYVWFKLAGTEKYADARKRRKKVANRLTPHEIAQADLMVKQWRLAHPPSKGR